MWPEQQLNDQKSEEELRLEHAMNNATMHDKAKWTLLEWYSANRTKDGNLCNDLKTQHTIVVLQTDSEVHIDIRIKSKTMKILEEITKIMQRFENDTIHLKHTIRRSPLREYGDRVDKCEIYIEYYLLSDHLFKS